MCMHFKNGKPRERLSRSLKPSKPKTEPVEPEIFMSINELRNTAAVRALVGTAAVRGALPW